MKAKDYFKKEWIQLIVLIIPFIIIGILWDKFPAKIPVHWNFKGEIDRYDEKATGLFFIPVLNILIYVLFWVLPKIDPRKANYKFFQGAYNVLRFSITLFLLLLFLITVAMSLGYGLDVGRIVIYLCLLLFLLIGNFMGSFRSNYFVGIRTPWTLQNEEVWQKTHRLGGRLWAWSSLAMIILGFFLSFDVFVILCIIYFFVIAIIPILYSYIIYRKIEKGDKEKQ
jgi:uncharacterized membrane protein